MRIARKLTIRLFESPGRFLLKVFQDYRLIIGASFIPSRRRGGSAMVVSCTLTVRDETADGRPAHEWRLDVLTERLSVRELLRDRIRREVEEYNTRRPHTWRGLVQPIVEPRSAGDLSQRGFRPVDWNRQHQLACEAFVAGRLLIVVGDAQAATLDDEFELRPGTAVTFLRLAPLVGG